MKPIKIGLVGIGRAGWGIHAIELDSSTDAVLMTQSKSL